MKFIKSMIVRLTTLSLITYIGFNYRVVLSSRNVSFKDKELPILKEDDQKEIILTSIGIFLVGLPGYILVSSYEKKGEK